MATHEQWVDLVRSGRWIWHVNCRRWVGYVVPAGVHVCGHRRAERRRRQRCEENQGNRSLTHRALRPRRRWAGRRRRLIEQLVLVRHVAVSLS